MLLNALADDAFSRLKLMTRPVIRMSDISSSLQKATSQNYDLGRKRSQPMTSRSRASHARHFLSQENKVVSQIQEERCSEMLQIYFVERGRGHLS